MFNMSCDHVANTVVHAREHLRREVSQKIFAQRNGLVDVKLSERTTLVLAMTEASQRAALFMSASNRL